MSDVEKIREWLAVVEADSNNEWHKTVGCKSCLNNANKSISMCRILLDVCNYDTIEGECSEIANDNFVTRASAAISQCAKVIDPISDPNKGD